jgi:hypothetical protein
MMSPAMIMTKRYGSAWKWRPFSRKNGPLRENIRLKGCYVL